VIDHGNLVAAGAWEALVRLEDSRLASLWAAQLGIDDDLVPQTAVRSS
jgi:hypothetical protein